MARRELQEINAGSMDDIAFQLVLFFFIATTMDTDSGIFRKLPPMPEEEQKQERQIKDRNIFVVLVNKDNQLLVENELMNIKYLREAVKEFIANPADRDDLPEKIPIEINYFGTVPVTKFHVISLQNDRGTSYGTYIAVQNELTAAYNELREELAMTKFGIKYNDLADEDARKVAIEEIYPLKISEAVPKNVGGS
jgi:biopolymer transport protein ExbD